MKHKQAETNEERPKTRAFVETPAALTLTNIPEVLVVSVLSFLDYHERSKVRRSCRRLLYSVDSMAAPLNLTLRIQLVPQDASTQVLQAMRGRTWTASWDNGRALVNITAKSSLPISDFPVVTSIRPTKLEVEPLDDVAGRVDARLIRHLATQVTKTVTNVSVVNLVASSAIELPVALAEFDKEGDGVTELQLSTCVRFVHTMSAILRLRKLRSLSLTMRREMIAGWRQREDSVGLQFTALAALPDLEELTVRARIDEVGVDNMQCSDRAVAGHMLGYSAITSLTNLSSDWLMDWQEGSEHAFAAMLHRLPNLESLSMLSFPKPQLWRQVHAAGGHERLQELGAQIVIGPDAEEVEALASACNNDFPALRRLEIQFFNALPFNYNDIVRAIARLKTHPSLSKIKCGWSSNAGGKDAFFQGLP